MSESLEPNPNPNKWVQFVSPVSVAPTSIDMADEEFQHCIKLATENKINQKNTWDLKLIDHLSEMVKEVGDETSYQKLQRPKNEMVGMAQMEIQCKNQENRGNGSSD